MFLHEISHVIYQLCVIRGTVLAGSIAIETVCSDSKFILVQDRIVKTKNRIRPKGEDCETTYL